MLVIVIVSVVALVEISIPELARRVKISVEESATTLECPATAIVAKEFETVSVVLIVMLSFVESVVIVTLDPATNVNVSLVASAITLDCPATAIVENTLLTALPVIVILSLVLSVVIVIPVLATH